MCQWRNEDVTYIDNNSALPIFINIGLLYLASLNTVFRQFNTNFDGILKLAITCFIGFVKCSLTLIEHLLRCRMNLHDPTIHVYEQSISIMFIVVNCPLVFRGTKISLRSLYGTMKGITFEIPKLSIEI